MTIAAPNIETPSHEAVRTRLLADRAELVLTLQQQNAATPEERTDVPDGPGETETLAIAEVRAVTARVAAITQVAIDEIDAALLRIAAGTYGACEACAAPIPAARLEALPAATHCVHCQGAREAATR